jgi:hypothetical protein
LISSQQIDFYGASVFSTLFTFVLKVRTSDGDPSDVFKILLATRCGSSNDENGKFVERETNTIAVD